jgi:hypothetical protein
VNKLGTAGTPQLAAEQKQYNVLFSFLSILLSSVAEPKLFVSALAPTFQKYRLQLQLFGYRFSRLLNEKVYFYDF